jgi:hypothetical protein
MSRSRIAVTVLQCHQVTYLHPHLSMTWQNDIEEWIQRKRKIPNDLAQSYTQIFELAFHHTYDPERSWFGVHKSGISLVVGQIYLLGVNLGTADHGIWLLLDRDFTEIDSGIKYQAVKSTRKSQVPLIWANVRDLEKVDLLINHSQIWQSYAAASRQILEVWVSGSRDDEFHRKKSKQRLSDFWCSVHQNNSDSIEVLTEYQQSEANGDFDLTSIEDARQR